MRKLKHSPYLLPLRPYEIGKERPRGRRKMRKAKEELQIENSDELRSLPESETQDEKMADEATTSTPPLSSCVHDQSLRMAALALEKKNKKKKPAPKASMAMESKAST